MSEGSSVPSIRSTDVDRLKEYVDDGVLLPSIWNLFERNKGSESGKCKLCNAVIRTPKGSTSALHTHGRTHSINARKRKSASNITSAPKVNSALEKLNREYPLESLVAEMVAVDRLPFLVFRTSTILRECLEAKMTRDSFQVQLPSSEKTLRDMVMRYGKKLKDIMREEIKIEIGHGNFFSIVFDEWTSIRNKRYLNLCAFTKSQYFNLGLVRITGHADSKNIMSLVISRLEEFGISFENHVVSLFTDGAATMVKIANNSTVDHQFCLAHGVQLAVLDCLYMKKATVSEEVEEEECSDEEEDCLQFDETAIVVEFSNESIKDAIDKVRSVAKLFKKSGLLTEKLEDAVTNGNGSHGAKTLLLDCRTRWSSLFAMLQRYWELQDHVDKVLREVKSEIKINRREKYIYACILRTLKPVMLTVKMLCCRDSNLLKARAALRLLFKQLEMQQNPISKYFLSRLKVRVKERWGINSSILKYLHEGSYNDMTLNDDEFTDEEDEFPIDDESVYEHEISDSFRVSDEDDCQHLDIFDIPNKSSLKCHLLKLLTRFEGERDVVSSEDTLAELHKRKKTFEERLNEVVSSADKTSTSEDGSISLSARLGQEMTALEKTKGRGKLLQKCYELLLSVRPTSVDSERVFSLAGLTCTKTRSRMGDDTLDVLIILRSFILSERERKKNCQRLSCSR